MKRALQVVAVALLAVSLPASWVSLYYAHAARRTAAAAQQTAEDVRGGKVGAGKPSLQPYGIIDPRDYGAVGDFSHDDTAAIVAATTAANAIGGKVLFVPPPVAYKTTSEIVVPAGSYWECNGLKVGQCTIKAGSAMRSMVATDNFQNGALSPNPNRFVGLTFDGNGLATNTSLRFGEFLSSWERCQFTHGVVNGQKAANKRSALQLGSVTCAGTCTAGSVTVSQPDTTYSSLSSTGTVTWRLKVTGGGLGSATYVLSQDGGSTYATASQTVRATSLISQTSGATYGPLSGVAVSFPNGTYTNNDTYTFTVTSVADDSFGVPVNADNRFYDDSWIDNGTVYATATLAGHFSGAPGGMARVITTEPGTATATNGSQLITFASGPDLTTLGLQEGDFLYVPGARTVNTIDEPMPILGVLDAATIAVPTASAPTATVAGANYAIANGAGYYEAGSGENIRTIFFAGASHGNPTAFRFGGSQGPQMNEVRTEQYGLVAYSWGTLLTAMNGAPHFDHVHIENGADIAINGLYTYSGYSFTATEPVEFWKLTGPGSGVTIQQSLIKSYNGGGGLLVPKYVESTVQTVASISAASTQIAMPVQGSVGTTSEVILTGLSGATVSSAAPLFTGVATAANGIRIRLLNTSSHPFTIVQDAFSNSGIKTITPDLTLTENSAVDFLTLNGKLLQVSQPTTPWGATGGAHSVVIRQTRTTDGTATVCFDNVDVALQFGTHLRFDVIGTSASGANYAVWDSNTVDYDVAGNVLGSTIGGSAGPGPNAPTRSTAGNAAAWRVSVTNSFPIEQVKCTGAASQTVDWKVIMTYETGPLGI